MNKELTIDDLKIIFDVLNVYDPNDIQDIYPKMGEEEFLDALNRRRQERTRGISESLKEVEEPVKKKRGRPKKVVE